MFTILYDTHSFEGYKFVCFVVVRPQSKPPVLDPPEVTAQRVYSILGEKATSSNYLQGKRQSCRKRVEVGPNQSCEEHPYNQKHPAAAADRNLQQTVSGSLPSM